MLNDDEKENLRRQQQTVKKVKRIYSVAVDEVFTGFVNNTAVMQARINEAILTLYNSLYLTVYNGIGDNWKAADKKNDLLFKKLFTPEALKNKAVETIVYGRNEKAFEQFINRRIRGLNLSDRIWKQAEQFKTSLEQKVTEGIATGKAAHKIAREVREYLESPLPSEKSQGKGIYRSPLKNSLRMARTETNMAYRRADIERWLNTPFVLGFKVNLSPQHPTKDICDLLADDYPTTFIFVGWHPNCLCYLTSILADREQMDKYTEAILNGTDADFKFKGRLTELPASLQKWVEDNREKYADHANPPYFIKDNDLLKQ